MITQQKTKDLFALRDDGQLVWKISNSNRVKVGDIAGTIHHDGYRRIMINGKMYAAHRIIWLMVHGKLPVDCLDHINGNGLDNRIINLREANSKQNQQNQIKPHLNNKIGFFGVSLHKSGKFVAQIAINRKKKYLGLFNTPEQAHEVYLKAKRELHEFCTI